MELKGTINVCTEMDGSQFIMLKERHHPIKTHTVWFI